ncbi:MAG: hypothetical protein ACK5WI_01160 [Cyanobacteriota bacterium]
MAPSGLVAAGAVLAQAFGHRQGTCSAIPKAGWAGLRGGTSGPLLAAAWLGGMGGHGWLQAG